MGHKGTWHRGKVTGDFGKLGCKRDLFHPDDGAGYCKYCGMRLKKVDKDE